MMQQTPRLTLQPARRCAIAPNSKRVDNTSCHSFQVFARVFVAGVLPDIVAIYCLNLDVMIRSI